MSIADEVRKEKSKLSKTITAALQEFTEKTGLVASGVHFSYAAPRDAKGEVMAIQYYDVALSLDV